MHTMLATTDLESVLIATIMRKRLCLRCVSAGSEIAAETLVGVIRQIQRSVTVIDNIGECDVCARRTVVYRLA